MLTICSISLSIAIAIKTIVGSKTIAIFGNFRLGGGVLHLGAWELCLVLVGQSEVLLHGFLIVFRSYDLDK